jgi:protein-tyrosine phosphatase
MGNICRSPMAEGAFRKCLEELQHDLLFEVDSAGTHGFHTDAPVAARSGIDISSLRARRVVEEDFERFDYIFAMDQDNLEWLTAQAPDEYHDKIRLFLEFSSGDPSASVPDPYYGPTSGFERVLEIVQEGAESLLRALIEETRGNR